MKYHSVAWAAGLLGAVAGSAAKSGLPVDKVYGVNLGSWLLSESWMFPNEWKAMGGEVCDDCSKCNSTEFDLVKSLGQDKADKVFEKHWSTWFTQDDVNAIADANLNTVRIPLGYWIVESLVNRTTEFYPRGGMKELKRGLRQLKAKNINVILDLHALPGVASPNQMFAGRCTSDVQFYTEANYQRALKWACMMTTLVHMDPDFSTVFSIEAINEPIMDYNQTPNLGEYEKDFVKTVRATEYAMGIKCPGVNYSQLCSDSSSADLGLLAVAKFAEPAIGEILKATAAALPAVASALGLSDTHVRRALDGVNNAGMPEGHGAGRGTVGAYGPVGGAQKRSEDAVPHGSSVERFAARKRAHRRGVSATLNKGTQRQCLTTSFMNKDWQYNNPANPADAAMGPQFYDAHLYFSFGGVADPNAQSYMDVICNTDRVSKAYADDVKNDPLVFGEWSLATNFNASDQFVRDWSDAQRYIYAGQADGWIFWSFKIEAGSVNIPAWSYFDALKQGYFSKDPSKLSNPNVCAPYIKNATTST